MTEHKRILIVDDDAKVLLVMEATLENLNNGTLVVAVGDGQAALEELQEQPFDLVISDVRMPGMNGIELVEIMREQGIDTAVIWITAYGCKSLEEERERLDVHLCLEKPLRIENIRQAALEILDEVVTNS